MKSFVHRKIAENRKMDFVTLPYSIRIWFRSHAQKVVSYMRGSTVVTFHEPIL